MIRKFGQLRLVEGLETIEAWSATATQSERNGLYEMLFTAADSVLLRAYVVGDGELPGEMTVLVRAHLAVTLTFPGPGELGVVAIGHPCDVVVEDSTTI